MNYSPDMFCVGILFKEGRKLPRIFVHAFIEECPKYEFILYSYQCHIYMSIFRDYLTKHNILNLKNNTVKSFIREKNKVIQTNNLFEHESTLCE